MERVAAMSLMAKGIMVAGIALAMAGPAAAQLAEGWYLGAEAGAALPRDAATTGGGQRWATDYSAGPAVLGTAGYGFGPGTLGRLRLEGEIGWRGADVDTVNGAPGAGDASATSLMANLVTDFLPRERVHPFIGLGLGGALVDASASTAASGFSGDDTVFAYQAMAGVGVDVSRDVGLSLAYRYFATQDPGLTATGGASASSEFASHAVTAGITFRFGASPAPAPVPAPVPAAMPGAAPMPVPVPAVYGSHYRVFFDWDSAVITPAGHIEVEKAAVSAKAGARPRLELTGHADRSGAEAFNMKLSLARAEAVKAALVRLGVDPVAISVMGRGEQEPLIATKDGVREARNRRVEIVLP